jgi:nickel/cobalt exporter
MRQRYLRRQSGLLRGVVFFLLLSSLLVVARPAHAHTPDMYGQSQSIKLMPTGLQVDWKITPGPLLADAIWSAADQNLDGSISQNEAQAWIAPFLSGLSFSLDSQPLGPFQVQSLHWPPSVDVLRTGEDSIGIPFTVEWPEGLVGKHSLEIHNAYLEPNSLNWFSLTAEQGMSFDSPAQDNGQLRFTLDFPNLSSTSTQTAGVSSLTSWNSGMPDLPAGFSESVSRLAVNLTASGPGIQTGQPTTGGLSAVTNALEGLVKTQTFSPLFLLGAFLLSLVLGSLHALTPSHGKTLVAAYLVGTHGKVRDAVFLGAVVTMTHTGSVIMLGLITLLASHFVLPSLITPWLEVISGLLVIGFGINLLIRRRRDLASWRRRGEGPSVTYRTGAGQTTSLEIASVTHSHEPRLVYPHDQPHDEHGEHGHVHNIESEHRHSHALPEEKVTWKSLLTLGISGGLVPCPDAIAILLVAVTVNRIPFGMLLIAAFSIGLALVLIAIGIAMVQSVRMIARSEMLTRFSVYAPMASALVVTGLGIALSLSAVNSFRFSSSVLDAPSQTIAGTGTVVTSQTPAFDVQHARLLYLASEGGQGRDQIYMLPLSGGDPVQWTQEPTGVTGYSVSPDKGTILYSTFDPDGGSSLWAMQTDGMGRRRLLDCPQAECNAPAWYPDSRKVVYERLEDMTDPSGLPRFSLWWLGVGTGDTMPVFRDQTFPSTAAAFSPDGQWLGYISYSNNSVQLYHLQDGRSLSLVLTSQPTLPELWSPSGDSILYWAPATSDPSSALHVQRYILSSGRTLDLGSAKNQTDYSAAWSPTGDWIAIDRPVSSSDNSLNGEQIWLMRPDGTGAHILLGETQKSYSDLSWSPDGNFIVYTSYYYQNLGQFNISLVDIQSGQQSMLVSGGSFPTLLP